jgi:hypothetical protein
MPDKNNVQTGHVLSLKTEYNHLEKTIEWKQERIGKFTSSEIHKILQKGRAKDKYFGDGAMTYIQMKAAELLTNLPAGPDISGLAAIEWGNAQEPDAVAAFEARYNLKVEYFGKANPFFFHYSEYAGGSPDGMISADAGLEIKAPYNSAEHISHLLIKDAAELYAEIPKYYWQCMANMLFTGAKHWYFVSYDPRFAIAEFQLKVIEIPYNEAHLKELAERITRAETELTNMVRTLAELVAVPANI